MKKVAKYDVGREAVRTLAKIITYAMCVNVFFFGLELFTAFYSNIPGHKHSIVYLFVGLHGHTALVPWFWAAAVMALLSLVPLIPYQLRDNPTILPIALLLLFAGTWIDKGLGLVVAGFIPNMYEGVTEYAPTGTELMISLMVYSIGALVLTILWKVAMTVKKEAAA